MNICNHLVKTVALALVSTIIFDAAMAADDPCDTLPNLALAQKKAWTLKKFACAGNANEHCHLDQDALVKIELANANQEIYQVTITVTKGSTQKVLVDKAVAAKAGMSQIIQVGLSHDSNPTPRSHWIVFSMEGNPPGQCKSEKKYANHLKVVVCADKPIDGQCADPKQHGGAGTGELQ